MFGLLGYLTSPIGLISLGLLVVCVVHSIRTGNVFPWIYVMVFLPGIGPLIYFFVVIVPDLFRSRFVVPALQLERARIDHVRVLRTELGIGGLQRVERGLRAGAVAARQLRACQTHEQRRIGRELA